MDTSAFDRDTEENTILSFNKFKEDGKKNLIASLEIDDIEDIIKEETDLKSELFDFEIPDVSVENKTIVHIPDVKVENKTIEQLQELLVKEAKPWDAEKSHKPSSFAYTISDNSNSDSEELHKCNENSISESNKEKVVDLELSMADNLPKIDKAACEESTKLFKCMDCKLEFTEQNSLKAHIKQMHLPVKNDIYKCSFCEYSSWFLSAFARHKNSYHKRKYKNRFLCECGYTTTSKYSFNHHTSVHERQEYELGEFKTANERHESKATSKLPMQQHLNSHSTEALAQASQLFACSQCEFKTVTRPRLKQHMTTHLNKYHCIKCERSFNDSAALVEHIKVHSQENPYRCHICTFSSKCAYPLKSHMRTHSVEKLCNTGGYQTVSKKSLKNYKEMVHETKRNLYKCEECDYIARVSYILKRHKSRHISERLFQCTKCELAFKNCTSLKAHAKVHAGVKPYKCSMCSYCAVLSSTIQRHFRKHTGEKPYACPDCSYCAGYSSNLQKHRKQVHLKIKPHQCKFCSMLRQRKAV